MHDTIMDITTMGNQFRLLDFTRTKLCCLPKIAVYARINHVVYKFNWSRLSTEPIQVHKPIINLSQLNQKIIGKPAFLLIALRHIQHNLNIVIRLIIFNLT